nr:TonB dependent receptor [Chryseobacterium lathyri]
MKNISILFKIIILFTGIIINGQSITGRLMSSQQTGIDYAEVSVSQEKTRFSAISDEKGNFFIKVPQNGNYKLSVLKDGKLIYEKNLEIINDTKEKITIDNKEISIQEINILKKKKLIERKVDRLVFNVENSISATGGDAMDALNITPGLFVQNNQISMIGKSSMSIMVNDRMLNLSGDDLANFLKNIRTEDIKSIEVITSPPSKYDAQGNSGLINIITKNVKTDSYNGNVRFTLTQSKRLSSNIGTGFNYNRGKLTFTSSVNYGNGSQEPYQRYTLEYPNYTWKEENTKRNYINNFGGRFTIDYKINNKIRIGGEYSGSISNPLIKSQNNSSIFNNSQILDSLIQNNSRIEINRHSNAFNLYSVIKLDTIGRKISYDFDYLDFSTSSLNNFSSNSYFSDNTLKPENYFSARNSSNLDVNIITSRLDFDYPTQWVKLNFGAKLTFINNESNVSFFNTTRGISEPDPLKSNSFEYKENTQALYISGSKKLNDKVEVQLGFRGENTQTEGNSVTLSQKNKNKYFMLFPTFNISYSFKEDKSVGLNYNRRINRPTYNNLNPFRFYSTSFNYAEGNPFLNAYTTDNIELSYLYKNSYTMLYASFINDAIDQVTFVSPESPIQRVIPTNAYNQYNVGIYQGYSFSLNRWESNNNLSVYYTRSRSNIPELKSSSAFSGSFKTVNSVILDKDKKYRAEASFLYRLPSLAGSYELSSFSQLNLGFKASLFKQRLNVTIEAVDVLKTNKQTFTQTVNNIRQSNYDYADIRRINLTLVYGFGQKLDLYRKKEVNTEEKQRIN